MKKIILTLALALIMAVSANAQELTQIGDSPYYSYTDDNGMFKFCDKGGNVIKEAPYFWAEKMGTGIVFKDKESLCCGIMDLQLNIVVKPLYSEISYNDNTSTFNCITDNGMDYYDNSFNKISQPLDISQINSTKYYSLKVIDDKDPSKTVLFICDKNGNKLINDEFAQLEGAEGSIIAERLSDFKNGIYDASLNLAIPFEYTSISFRNNRFYCENYSQDAKKSICLYADFTPAAEV